MARPGAPAAPVLGGEGRLLMFRKAISKARLFTQPVIVSGVTASGKCSSLIGAFTIVNEDGWIVTAGHIMSKFYEFLKQAEDNRVIDAKKASIRADNALSDKQKRLEINKLPRLGRDHIIGCSAWWGTDAIQIVDMAILDIVDLGIGRLEPFVPDWVASYPMFKDPGKDFQSGVSLCKLGFPFYRIATIWNNEKMKFEIPAGALPLPFFPIEGIFTREVNIITDGPQPSYPLQWIETSSPGLKGQSGGPIFDVDGVVWGIQSHTQPYPLGFDPLAPGSSSRKEHQFLNVGRGVHSSTIIGALTEMKIKFKISDD
jgi:hypothetical protein